MMKRLFGWQTAVWLTLLLVACSGSAAESEDGERETAVDDATAAPIATNTPEPTVEVLAVDLEDLGPAPEIENEIWLNTDEPIPLASQRGKVVLLEFWTFG